MSQSYSKKYTMPHLNGFAAAAVLVAINHAICGVANV